MLLAIVLGAGTTWAANAVTIPTAAGNFIDWNDATITGGGNVENSGANIGSTGKNTVATFTVSNSTQQDYVLTFATGTKNEAKMVVTLTNTTSGETVLSRPVDIVNTGNWTPVTVNSFFLSQLPAGDYELTFAVTEATGYAGNWGKLAFYTTEDRKSVV